MPNYRRYRVPGGCYFFTVNLADRRSNLLASEIDALRDAVRETRRTRPFHIDAWVVLPDHLHCLWTLPPGDADFPNRWRTIKTLFSRRVAHPQDRRPSLVRKREVGVWQRRYWEHMIRDDCDYAAHMDYIHFNPVRHGVAKHPAEWPFSSFLRCVARGVYPEGWAVSDVRLGEAGERPEQEAVLKPTLRAQFSREKMLYIKWLNIYLNFRFSQYTLSPPLSDDDDLVARLGFESADEVRQLR